MSENDITRGLRILWETRPTVVVLLVLGFLIFLFVVVDTWRHKRKRKHRR